MLTAEAPSANLSAAASLFWCADMTIVHSPRWWGLLNMLVFPGPLVSILGGHVHSVWWVDFYLPTGLFRFCVLPDTQARCASLCSIAYCPHGI